jgi:hypothetical protein
LCPATRLTRYTLSESSPAIWRAGAEACMATRAKGPSVSVAGTA